MNNNKRADYVAIDTEEQKLRLYLNAGEDGDSTRFKSGGVVTIGTADPKNIRLADIDGDGFWDCIILFEGGRVEIYRNAIGEGSSDWYNLGSYEPSGIWRPPAEIQFIDIDGDGKADYVWTEPIAGSVKEWLNNYPNLPSWLEVGEVTKGAGTSGANVQFARLRPKKELPLLST
ncbi:lipolytic G-D-S-L family [Fusarium beomiforme]|uniref:Lipolytic G-D-S-L family n=1 Tax=Fusarium beomiforme TaxID=44412 RepID=A0A9P5AA12_9HYPO|nr:lipolytic G-D-S-L family [Fusarium beomiforme]